MNILPVMLFDYWRIMFSYIFFSETRVLHRIFYLSTSRNRAAQ